MQKLKNILNIYKPVGISPLDAIKLLKEKYPELKNEKKIEQKISLIKGDFRQKKILSHWQKMLPKFPVPVELISVPSPIISAKN